MRSGGVRGMVGVVAVTLLAACTSSAGEPAPGWTPTPERPQIPAASTLAPAGPLVLEGSDAVTLALQACRAVWLSSPVVVTAAAADPLALPVASERAAGLAVPLLALPDRVAPSAEASSSAATTVTTAAEDAAAVEAELDRLGVTHVLHIGDEVPDLAGVEVVTASGDLPAFAGADPVPGLTALTAPKAAPGRSEDAALASLAAAGATIITVADRDPRAFADDVEALAGRDPRRIVGVGSRFGQPDVFAQRVEAAATGVQLPGGGQTIFDGKRYVALYGHPLTGALGVLGEQGPRASVVRAREVAAQYEAYADETIVPAFEIIATVAAGSAGRDGDYSNEWDVEVLRPLVDAAASAGIYVVLDLQSGRDDFLSQAMLYEELLREPHVGLAMDPEWRLEPDQKPLRQIGSVTAAELNEAFDWLADLTDTHDLPQKMVLLHQFRTDMITDRPDVDLGHDELAVIVQMDGDGTLGQKLDTWDALRTGAPRKLRFGWKNFYDEDEPTPSPRTTFRVQPKPWWVSYQ